MEPGTHGEAVQVDPIKSTLKAPDTKRLKLNYDALLPNSAFKFSLRRYNTASPLRTTPLSRSHSLQSPSLAGADTVHLSA